MRFSYLGNFGAPHSTENDVARALENNGHDVTRIQEAPQAWDTMGEVVAWSEPDVVLWTTTFDYAPPPTFDAQRRFLDGLRKPIVGYHLDRWWGLDRENRIADSPFFRVDLLCTADGGHDAEWNAAGVNHEWFPPAVSRREAEIGTPQDHFRSDIAFVGSWAGGYHKEWAHRTHLVQWLRKTYRDRVKFWPERGHPRIVGQDLRDLYASTKVLIGDSCLAGDQTRYWSDRIPETLGRGGYLIHPYVEGLEDTYLIGDHLNVWAVGEWHELKCLIDWSIEDDAARAKIAEAGRDHVLACHTYERRMEQLVACL